MVACNFLTLSSFVVVSGVAVVTGVTSVFGVVVVLVVVEVLVVGIRRFNVTSMPVDDKRLVVDEENDTDDDAC